MKIDENKVGISKMKSSISKIGIIFIVFVVLAIIFMLASFIFTEEELPITVVKNLFIDVNGDGKIDFVKYMEAVINSGNLAGNP